MDGVSYGNPASWALLNEGNAGDIYINKKHSKKVLEEMINFFVVKTTLILFSVSLGHICTKLSIWKSEHLLCVSWFSTSAIQVLGLGRQQGLNLMSYLNGPFRKF